MGVSPGAVYWNQTSPPGCTGLSIISVMQEVARPYTSQLLGRVDERLSNGSIVIHSLRPEDAGFYVVCAESSSTPVRTILLTVAEPHPVAATTEPALNNTTHNNEKQTRHRGVVVAVLAVLVVAIAAAVVIWVNKKHRQHQSLELQPCRGSSEEEAGQSPEPLHQHLQQNGDTAVVQDYPPTCLSTGEKSDHQETAPILLERNDPEGRNRWIVSNGASNHRGSEFRLWV
ncbi:uncharacterized protein [Ambystoma mexicanum]